MDDGLQKPAHAYVSMREQMERLGCALRPSYLSVHEQMTRALEPYLQQHRQLSDAIRHSGFGVSFYLTDIVQASQRWQDLIGQSVAAAAIEDAERIHKSWRVGVIKSMQDSIAQMQTAATMSLGDLVYRMTATEQMYAKINLHAMQQAVAFPKTALLRLESIIGKTTLTYGNLASSIRDLTDVTQLPSFALSGATREVFLTGHVLETVCTSEAEEEEDGCAVEILAEAETETAGCIAMLHAVDPALATPYVGARDALQSGNSDRARHVLSSLRELWNHLLRRIAPDEQVLPWAAEKDRNLLHEGRPTRKARILYLSREINHGALTNFIVQDTGALIALVELFNRVHELDLNLTDQQLRALILRADSWLMYILQIWEGPR